MNMDPNIINQVARIEHEERLRSFEEVRQAVLAGAQPEHVVLMARVRRLWAAIQRQFAGQPTAAAAPKRVTSTQEVARASNC